MRRHALLLVFHLVSLALPGCLRVPPTVDADGASPAPDAGAAEDAPSAPAPLSVLGWSVTDPGERSWTADAAPRWPVLRVQLSEPPYWDADDGPPVWLFTGAADADLRDDLADDPLRAATRERVVPCDVALEGADWILRPKARLEAGATYTVGVGAWVEASSRGQRLGAPWTDELRVSEAPEAGAEVTGSWPADGAAAVAPSIAEIAVRFDGPVEGVEEGVTLLDGDTPVEGEVQAAPCASLGWSDGWCARLRPGRALARGAAHRLVVAPSVRDATGAPVGPWEARFVTAAEPDREPPTLSAPACALDEAELPVGCLFVDDARFALRLRASEPVRVSMTVAGRELRAVAPRGEATLSTGGLPPEATLDAVLRAEDAAGRATAREVVVRTLPPLATVSLVEVRADPAGAEPSQEYVEVLNYGTMTVDLAGFALSDRVDALGDVVLRSSLLAPGQRALLVADGFDPDDPADPPVPPGVPLVRLGRSLAGGGLRNAGEPLFLRDAEGHRLSAAPALAAPAEGECLVRVSSARRAGDPEHFAGGPCTPGTAPTGAP